MISLAGAKWMPGTLVNDKVSNRNLGVPAKLALVFRLLAAFIKFVLSFARPEWMIRTVIAG